MGKIYTIEWNKVTWYSKLLAIILFIAVIPVWTFYLGTQYGEIVILNSFVFNNIPVVPGNLQHRIPSQMQVQTQNATSTGVLQPTTNPLLKITAPIGGETICTGKEYIIKWQAPVGMKDVVIVLYAPHAPDVIAANVPAVTHIENGIGYGEYEWGLGDLGEHPVESGTNYGMLIQGSYEGHDIFANTDPNTFSVMSCPDGK